MHRYRLPAVSASYPPQQSDNETALMAEPVFDGDEELGVAQEGRPVPYAHRDIKPGYVDQSSIPLSHVAAFPPSDLAAAARHLSPSDSAATL